VSEPNADDADHDHNIVVGYREDLPGVADLVIGSGSHRNALSGDDWTDLAAECVRLGTDESLRAVIVRGTGGTFSAGSDMREWVRAEPADVDDSFARMEAAFTAIERLPVPVVAQVDGAAAGAGCQLALACDLRVLGETARIGMPIARLGILASPAFAARVSLLTGPAIARELLYTGRLVTAEQAVRLGLANRAVPEDILTETTTALVRSIVRHPPAALRAAKHAVSVGTDAALDTARAAGTGPAVAFPDFRRAITAFLDRDQENRRG
jgi:enoyl-CoA hydratase/carnithine racemase